MASVIWDHPKPFPLKTLKPRQWADNLATNGKKRLAFNFMHMGHSQDAAAFVSQNTISHSSQWYKSHPKFT